LLAALLLVGIGVASLSSGGGKKQTSARATGTSTSAAGAKRTHHAAHRATHRTAGTSAALPSQTSSSAANSSGSAATSSAATTSAPVASTPAPSAVPASPTAPTTPSTAVQMFYEAAAHHDYAAAWQLADANLRNQLQGYDSFRAQMSAVRVITFHQAQTVARGSSSATVALDTTAVLIDKTQHCDGTATTTRASTGAWLVDHLSISCTPV
jgi:hypothetical protein